MMFGLDLAGLAALVAVIGSVCYAFDYIVIKPLMTAIKELRDAVKEMRTEAKERAKALGDIHVRLTLVEDQVKHIGHRLDKLDDDK